MANSSTVGCKNVEQDTAKEENGNVFFHSDSGLIKYLAVHVINNSSVNKEISTDQAVEIISTEIKPLLSLRVLPFEEHEKVILKDSLVSNETLRCLTETVLLVIKSIDE